ncbi:hypothetical protein FRC00_001653 [Tulasnella sp. 408]|nr:hypothetical protein FRC00_001653 [Tulasnella sp. 408]
MKQLSPLTIFSIISLDTGESHRKISASAIGGRPKILGDQDVRNIMSGKTDNAVQTAHMLRSAIKKQVGPATVWRELSAVGLRAKVKVAKPLLLQKHRQDSRLRDIPPIQYGR